MSVLPVSLTFTRRRKVWVFPPDRFVEYGPEDEWWARKYEFGHEHEVSETITVPRAYVSRVGPDGSVEFTAVTDLGPVTLGWERTQRVGP